MKALYSYSNNFGSSSLKFFAHLDERIVVLTGRIAVNTAHAKYAEAETLQMTFPANTFPFERSEVATAYLCAFNEGERIYAVPVRARIISSRCIEVEKLDAYDTNSHDVELYFNTGFIAQGEETLLQPTASQKLTFRKEGESSAMSLLSCHNRFEQEWGFLSVIFEWFTIPANSDYEIEVAGLPADAECDALVFLAGSSNYDGIGCRVSKAHIENGKLTIHNESEYEIYSPRTFMQIFFTRVKRYKLIFNGYGTHYYVEGETILYPRLPEYTYWNISPTRMPDHDLYANTFYDENYMDI